MGGEFLIAHAVFSASDILQSPQEKPRAELTEMQGRAPLPPARFGYIISKAVGNAVVRNRTRRRLKAISDALVREGVAGVDVVFRALPSAATAQFRDLEREVRRQVRRLTERHTGGAHRP